MPTECPQCGQTDFCMLKGYFQDALTKGKLGEIQEILDHERFPACVLWPYIREVYAKIIELALSSPRQYSEY